VGFEELLAQWRGHVQVLAAERLAADETGLAERREVL
jgi:hypothetical protein